MNPVSLFAMILERGAEECLRHNPPLHTMAIEGSVRLIYSFESHHYIPSNFLVREERAQNVTVYLPSGALRQNVLNDTCHVMVVFYYITISINTI